MTAPPSRDGSLRRALTDARRDAGRRSFRAFCRTYLPAYFRLEPCSMHLELFELLERASRKRGARLAVAAPRGHAKTSIVSTAYLLWCICYRLEPYIVLVSNTADQARDLLSHLKRELEGNTRLIEDFPEVCEMGARPGPPRWRKDEIITRNDVKVTAAGVGGSIRGRKHGSFRPSLVVLDDVENETEVRSPDHRAKVLEWFNKAVAKLGTGTTNIVVVGTILHFDALLGRLTDGAKSPGWTGGKYKAVIAFAERADLWETWEAVYTHREEYQGASGPAAAETFYRDHEPDLLAGARVLWPQHESYKALMEMRVREGRVAFDCEKQNEPTDPETCLFRDADFCYWDDQYSSEQELLAALGAGAQFYGACDPSLGKKGRQHDDTAILTLVKDAAGVHYVLDADIRKRKPDDILNTVTAYHARRRYQRFGFEVNQFQEFLGDELVKRSRAAGVEVPVYKIAHSTDKLLRIQTLQPLVSSGGIRFSRRHALLLEQLRQFPHGAHDDGPDALEMAVEAGRNTGLIGVWVYPGADGPRDDDDWGWTPINGPEDFYRHLDQGHRWS